MDLLDKLDPPSDGTSVQVRLARVLFVATAAFTAEAVARIVFNKTIAPKLVKEVLEKN